jgi:DNA-binding NtrC family response regulator
MRLVADRFVVDHDRRSGVALDLATRLWVWIDISPIDDAHRHREWLIGCDELFRTRYRGAAPLVDYGSIGTTDRFEAWARTTSTDNARSPGDGWEHVKLIERPVLRALAELFGNLVERRPRVVVLWGAAGAGLRTAVLALARDARLRGFIPIDSRALDSHAALVAGRSLFTIDRVPNPYVTAFVRASLFAARAHVHLVVARSEMRGIDSVALGALPSAALVEAVHPPPAGERSLAWRAAQRAHGLPGRFVRMVWPETGETGRTGMIRLSRVAESSACYGDIEASRATPAEADLGTGANVWPAPGELAALRRRVEQAHSLLAAGRHAPGLRLMRKAVGALARRGAWTNAAQGTVTLASELLKRGRPRDALRALEDAGGSASRAGDAALLLDIALLTGECRLELARLDDAERVLASALTSARAGGDRWRAARIGVGLARTLFWRGEYADAAAAVDPVDGETIDRPSVPLVVRRLRLRAAISAGLRESIRALALVDEARAAASNDPALRADVGHTSALIKLAIGDLDGAQRDASSSLADARVARMSMRAVCARLLCAEAERRRGRKPGVAELVALRRLAAAAPPLVKARWDLFAALLDASDDAAVVARHTAATGLKALELWAPPSDRRSAGSRADMSIAEVIDILHVCQSADDEVAVLRDVCERVRRQLHAASVAIAISHASRCDLVVVQGARIDCDIAHRCIESSTHVGPHRIEDRIEAAAPVLYAGNAIGALCVRWTLGTTHDLSRATSVLAMSAAAAAPVIAAAAARRMTVAPGGPAELIGMTPVVADLRRAVESAAVAPFPVLIVGESGSGKELVARGVHRASPRRDRAFCTLNCAALPDELIESELFGHTRGAFTGAAGDRAGVFEEAHGGTLFLDEVGELSARAQAKLLRVLQEGELRRIGENIARRVDARIVAATNRDLRAEVEGGRFRLDLLYRLDVIRISVPPLRDRREDVPALVDHFWADTTRKLGSRAALAAATRVALAGYDWPGNVRELQNVLAALAVRSPRRGVVPPAALPPHVVSVRRPDVWRLDAARRTFEESFVRAALVRAGGHRGRAADELGVTRQGLTKLLARLGID